MSVAAGFDSIPVLRETKRARGGHARHVRRDAHARVRTRTHAGHVLRPAVRIRRCARVALGLDRIGKDKRVVETRNVSGTV